VFVRFVAAGPPIPVGRCRPGRYLGPDSRAEAGLGGAHALMPAATLSRTEFEVAWSTLGLGGLPFPLAANGDRPVVDDAAVLADLAGRGLAAGDRLRGDVVDCLTVLALPERSVDAVGGRGYRMAVLAAAAHGMAALAVLDQDGGRDTVVVGPIRERSLVESVVALLPGMPAGPGPELTVPVAVVRRFLAGDEAGVAPADAAVLARLAESRIRGGQLGVNMADRRSGLLYRGIPVVSWFDTDDGRYLMTNDGTTLSVAPADSALIAVRLHEVLAGHR
jgi:hypothetical protein